MNSLTPLAIYHALVQVIPGDAPGGAMPSDSPMNGWAVIAVVVTAFTGAVAAIGKMAGPTITSWAASRARKLDAQAQLAEDVLVHQRERDDRDARMELRLEKLERRIGKVSDVIYRRCGKHEDPDSDVDLDSHHDSKATL